MKVVCFDLDDTLYKEIDYLKSAYREITIYAANHCYGCSDSPMILAVKAYDVMLQTYMNGGNAFERLNDFLGLNIPISDYLQIYHEHKPDILLSDIAVLVLDALKASGSTIGLITDGRSIQQRNKIEALRLHRWIDDEDMVISEEYGSEKPTSANYEYFMERYPNCKDFTYVGDNLRKDFIAPNALRWTTICLKDDGRNVHKQDCSSIAHDAMPGKIIKNLGELVNRRN